MTNKRNLPTLKSLGVTAHQRKRFFTAIENGDIATVDNMLKDGMPANIFDVDGKTALGNATYAKQNRSEILLSLIAAGADTKVRNDAHHGGTLLHRHAKHPKVIAALLDGGLCPATLDEYGCSPVHSAIKSSASTPEALISAELLIKAGAPLQNTLKDQAPAQNGEKQKAVVLHPIHLAANEWNLKALNLLLSAGASPVQWSASSSGTLPLQIAIQADNFSVPTLGTFSEVLDVFLQHGLDVNATNRLGQTGLHTAIAQKKPEQIKLLIERGATLNYPADSEGNTPWQIAEKQMDPAVMQILHTVRARQAIEKALKKAPPQP